MALLALGMAAASRSFGDSLITILARLVYWFAQGTMFWAVFVLGHDCGHGSFSVHGLLNDIVGLILHSAILVPYVPWKLSHRHHHKFTGNLDKDEVYYPIRQSDSDPPTPFLFGLGFGWLTYVVTGYPPRAVSHINWRHPLFARHVIGTVISILCWFGAVALLLTCSYTFGFRAVMTWYGVPQLIFGSWLVITTFLHHNDENVPWFADSKWDYVRGNLSSVDRDFGWLHNVVHNIGTHQVHHLFPIIPHYHLEEATAAFRTAFPQLVRRSAEPIIPAALRMWGLYRDQHRVPDDVQVFAYCSAQKR